MKTITKSELKTLIPADKIQERIKELADILNSEYKEEDVYVICVLKGAVMFMTDLVKYLTFPLQMEFIRLSSYGSGKISTGKVNAVDIKLPDLNGKNVLIVEDIIDTGHTAKFLTEFVHNNFSVKSYKFISLLDKPSRRVENINPDLSGFVIEDKFVGGYGLDFDGYCRNLDFIGYIEP